MDDRPIWALTRLAGPLSGRRYTFVQTDGHDPGSPRWPNSRRAALVGLILTLLLVVGGVLLVHLLGRAAALQDCVMSGRTHCAPIDSTSSTR